MRYDTPDAALVPLYIVLKQRAHHSSDPVPSLGALADAEGLRGVPSTPTAEGLGSIAKVMGLVAVLAYLSYSRVHVAFRWTPEGLVESAGGGRCCLIAGSDIGCLVKE